MTSVFETLSLFLNIKRRTKVATLPHFTEPESDLKTSMPVSVPSFSFQILIDLKMATQAVLYPHTEGQLIDKHTW